MYDDKIVNDKDKLIERFLKGGEKVEETKKYLSDDYLNDFSPLEIKVHGNNFERAFRNFRFLVQKERIIADFKQKQSYEKPSVKRRRKQNEMRQKRLEMEARQAKIDSGEFEKELMRKQKLKEEKKKLREEKRSNG